MHRKLSDLAEEMLDLKKCQIDMLKIAITIFAIISSVLLGFLRYCTPSSIVDDLSINYRMTLSYLGLFAIIPILFPYMIWIIIHKCRSLFRISSYIRLLEDKNISDHSTSNTIPISIIGYETLYRKMRDDPWFLVRFEDSWWKNYINRYMPYSYWYNKYQKAYPSKLKESYKGGFYSRVVRMIAYMAIPFFILFISTSFWYIHHFHVGLKMSYFDFRLTPFWLFPFLIIFYALYNIILLNRYNKEIMGIPFSHDAQYEMWKRALDSKEEAAKIG